MADYFSSIQFREDYNNLLKSMLLLSKKMDQIALEIHQLRVAQTMNLNNAPDHRPTIFTDDDME